MARVPDVSVNKMCVFHYLFDLVFPYKKGAVTLTAPK